MSAAAPRACKGGGKPGPSGRSTCSPECRAIRQAELRRNRRYVYLFYGGALLVMALYLLVYLGVL